VDTDRSADFQTISSSLSFTPSCSAANRSAIREPTIFLPALFLAEFLLFLNTGPLNAVLVGCVPAEIRATAMAMNILFIHTLGDAPSPPIIGVLSDHFGLFLATMIAPAMMLASGGVLLYAIRLQTPPGET